MPILVFICCCFCIFQEGSLEGMERPTYTYLALGDSYTIGEGLAEEDNFPNQVVRLLNNTGYTFNPPTIIAKTGWTTDELLQAISKRKLVDQYTVVTLLIGVNNQY